MRQTALYSISSRAIVLLYKAAPEHCPQSHSNEEDNKQAESLYTVWALGAGYGADDTRAFFALIKGRQLLANQEARIEFGERLLCETL